MSRPAWILVVSLAVLSPAGETPASDGAPLPDETALLAEVLENQNRVEQAREAYTYTMTVTDLKRGSGGDVMRGAARTYEVFYVAGKQFRKLVAENGRPSRPDEARKEEGRVAKAVREHRERQSRQEATTRPGDDDVTPADVLRLCRLVNPRREELRGQPAVVYDFEPRSGVKPRGRAESWIARTGGRVWVDEQARRLLRLEVQVKSALKVGGGAAPGDPLQRLSEVLRRDHGGRPRAPAIGGAQAGRLPA